MMAFEVESLYKTIFRIIFRIMLYKYIWTQVQLEA